MELPLPQWMINHNDKFIEFKPGRKNEGEYELYYKLTNSQGNASIVYYQQILVTPPRPKPVKNPLEEINVYNISNNETVAV